MVKGVLNRKKVTFRIKDRSIIKSAVGEAVPAGGTTGHVEERLPGSAAISRKDPTISG